MFCHSNVASNSSSLCYLPITGIMGSVGTSTLESSFQASEVSSLRRLSDNLGSVFESPEFKSFADAKIVVGDGREVPVHMSILAARSPFFKMLFLGSKYGLGGVKFELKDFAKDHDIGFDSLMLVLGYLYSGKMKPLPKDLCFCADNECLHVACRPVVDFIMELLYVSFVFQIEELVSHFEVRFRQPYICVRYTYEFSLHSEVVNYRKRQKQRFRFVM